MWIAIYSVVFLLLGATSAIRYEPTWKSLDSRPLPKWYDESKFGIFIHWGVFSVPSFGDEWFWSFWKQRKYPAYIEFMKKNYAPNFEYQDFAPQFKAEFYDPSQWAELFKASGAKYVVLTSKHHEGFCNWDTKYSWNWNSMAVGPGRDLVGDLMKAIRNNTDIHFGLYHSLFEWFNPLYLQDQKNKFKTNTFVVDKTMPELYELVEKYKPDLIWSDGDAGPPEYFNSTGFLSWLYNDSPVKDQVVTNDRWGNGIPCHHGGYYTCQDRYLPGKLVGHKWENAMTIDKKSWGFRRDARLADYLTMPELVSVLVNTVSLGGNLLMNIGPTHEGLIEPIFQERLRGMGEWLSVNGDAIYATQPWRVQNDTTTPKVWYTSKNTPNGVDVFAIMLEYPKGDNVVLGAPSATAQTSITLMGTQLELKWKKGATGGIVVQWPMIPANQLPCKWAWVLKLMNVK